MLGIRHFYCAPDHPPTKSKIECFHETRRAGMNLLIYTRPEELRTMQEFRRVTPTSAASTKPSAT